MKKTIITLLALLLYFYSNAQSKGIGANDEAFMHDVKMSQRTQFEMKKSKLNFFLDRNWKGGVIFSEDSTSINNYLFRYNIYTDQMEYRSVIDPETISVISIGSQKFMYSSFVDEDSTLTSGYFELIENGYCKLLLRRNIKFSEGRNDIDAYGSSSSTNIRESLFIKKGNEPALLIEKNKDGLKEVLSDKKEVVEYIDDKMILFVTKKTIKEIIEYYNKI